MGQKYLEPLQRRSPCEDGSANRRRHREKAQQSSLHHSIPRTRPAVRSPWNRTRDPSCALQWVSVPPQEHENRPNRWSVGCTTRSTSPLSAHFRGRHQRVRLFTLLPSTEVPDRSRTLGVSEIAGQYRTFPIRTEGCAMFRPAAPLCDGLPPPRRLARPARSRRAMRAAIGALRASCRGGPVARGIRGSVVGW
jgi:hypothetical protein